MEDGRIAIGYLSYEAVLLMEDYARSFMKPPLPPGWPPLGEFVVPSNVVVYDNALRRAYVNAKLEDLGHGGDHSLRLGEMVRGGTRREDYERWVGEAIEDIRSGEAFQIVLSRFEEYGFSGNLFPPLYSALADLNPSPYMFYLRMGGPRVLLGSSPRDADRGGRRQGSYQAHSGHQAQGGLGSKGGLEAGGGLVEQREGAGGAHNAGRPGPQ